ncbi:MAG: DUF11 domain-containing protein [Rubrobacteraceae bacterium]
MSLYTKRFGIALVALGILWVLSVLLASPAHAQALTVLKTGTPNTVPEGGEVTYTIDVTNSTGATADGVTLEDNLPDNFDFESAESTIGSCTQAPAADAADVTCEIGALNDDETATVTIVATAGGNSPAENEATASSTTPGVDSATDTAETTVVPDLVIEKFDNPDPVRVDDNLTYSLRVTNRGSTDATDVSVTDDLPNIPLGTVSPVEVEGGSGFDCTTTSGRVRCTGGSIASGESARILFVVRPEEAGTIDNTAIVEVGGFEFPEATQATSVQSDNGNGDNGNGDNGNGDNGNGDNGDGDNGDGDNGDGDNGDGDGGSASEQYSDDVEVTNIINIPDKDLPKTGGPAPLFILFSVVAGAGLLTAVARRRS